MHSHRRPRSRAQATSGGLLCPSRSKEISDPILRDEVLSLTCAVAETLSCTLDPIGVAGGKRQSLLCSMLQEFRLERNSSWIGVNSNAALSWSDKRRFWLSRYPLLEVPNP